MNYFIIPGNPPAVFFYQEWKKEIESHNPKAQVKVAVYPKLSRTRDSSYYFEQILHSHETQLSQFARDCSGEVTVIGHSLGGNFALRLLGTKSNSAIKKAVLIHPFLRSPDVRGKLILNVVSGLLSVEALLVKNRKLLDKLSKDLPYVTDEELEKTLHIGYHERAIIAADSSPLKIAHEHKDKLHVFYTPKDSWCGPQVVKELRAQVKVVECSEPHDFVTVKQHRDSFTQKILKL